MERSGWTISIDFGTAMCKCAAAMSGSLQNSFASVRALPIGQASGAAHDYLVPSAMFLSGRDIVFGPDAVNAEINCQQSRREALRSFKLMLGANNLEARLRTQPNRKIDPTGAFTYRDLITVFLAYLLDLVDSASSQIGIQPDQPKRYRYCQPDWPRQSTQGVESLIGQLLQDGDAVRSILGGGFWRRPVSYEAIFEALKAKREGVFSLEIEGGILEASAVAAAYLEEEVDKPHCMLVLDIGAGTTDLGTYLSARRTDGGYRILSKVETLMLAGDDIDRVVLDELVSSTNLGIQAQDKLWRRLLPQIMQIKERLFNDGEVNLEVDDVRLACSVTSIVKSREYQSLAESASKGFERLHADIAERAQKAGVDEILGVSAGGGAQLPFVADVFAEAAKKRPHGRKFRAMPRLPGLVARAVSYGGVGQSFQQLAIALGAAAAPSEFLLHNAVKL